ncbi:MAG: ABC transporter transmembrane domain-containing protein, partial [Chloroflexota bacterium]
MKALLKIRFLVKPYWRQIVGAIITLFGVTYLQLLVPGIIQDVIDEGLMAGENKILVQSTLLIFAIGLARAILSFGQRYLSEYIAMNAAYDTRNKLYNHIQHLSFTFHDHSQTGQLMSRCTEDVRSIQTFIGSGFIEIAQISLLLIGTITLMFIDNAKLALIVMIPMIPLVLVASNFGTRVSKMFYAIDKALGNLSARLQENVSGVQVVRAFNREAFEVSRFDTENKNLYDARITVISAWSRIMPTTTFFVAVSTILILWFGGQMALAGEITIGQVVAFNTYMLLLAMPARQLTWFVNGAGEASAGVQRVFEVLDRNPIITTPNQALKIEKYTGQVEFDSVSFTYEGESEPALTEISFKAEPQQTIALIGPTGSGKTTLVNLISRFYDVNQGRVLVDGKDVRHLDLIELRRQIGIV